MSAYDGVPFISIKLADRPQPHDSVEVLAIDNRWGSDRWGERYQWVGVVSAGGELLAEMSADSARNLAAQLVEAARTAEWLNREADARTLPMREARAARRRAREAAALAAASGGAS